MKQRDVFMATEGDAWFERNLEAHQSAYSPETDPLADELLLLTTSSNSGDPTLLEIGCSGGARLEWLQRDHGVEVHGIDPSQQGVALANSRGVQAVRGTANDLPFESGVFDVVIFGFCLYLCDRDDLFVIASEADRVLRSPGWLLIHDFYAPTPLAIDYKHHVGVKSFKMDYTSLFTWHPDYSLQSHRIQHHSLGTLTDEPSEMVAISTLRKRPYV